MGTRVALHLRDPELIRWAIAYTHASSVSEAIERALIELRRMVQERRRAALEQFYGI